MAELGGLERGERNRHLRMRLGLRPILGDALPLDAEAFRVGVAVLDHQRLHPLGMREHDAVTDGSAVVLEIKAVAIDLELFEQRVDRLGQMIEGVGVLRRRQRVALSEARIIRRDQMIARGQ